MWRECKNTQHSTSFQRLSKTLKFIPVMESSPQNQRSKLRTKRFLLNRSKKDLQRLSETEKHEKKKKQLDDETSKLHVHVPPHMAAKVHSHRYLAYNTTGKLQSERFQKLLENFKQALAQSTPLNNKMQPACKILTNHSTPPNHKTQMSQKTPPDLKSIWLLTLQTAFLLEWANTQLLLSTYWLGGQELRSRLTQQQQNTRLRWPQSKRIYKPNSMDELENKLQRIHQELHVKLEPQKKWFNISNADLVCLWQRHLTLSMIPAPIKRYHSWLLNSREQSQLSLEEHLLRKQVLVICHKEVYRLQHQPTQVLSLYKDTQEVRAQTSKCDQLYLTSTDPHSTSCGCFQQEPSSPC